jgi:hypothetical protein
MKITDFEPAVIEEHHMHDHQQYSSGRSVNSILV